MSLSTKVLIGLGLGMLAGVFFGEEAAFLKVLGDAFIQLLQMTVLPYMMVSLITGLGGLSFREAASLGRSCGVLLLVLWSLGLAIVLILPLAYPDWEMASFFSTSLIEERQPINFLGLYIPANLFYSLANNIVPAVVVFSVAVGVALIGLKDKEVLLKSLSTLGEALTRITNVVIHRLAPFGVFAIIASATGTMRFDDLERLQVYMVTYPVASLLLTFWILPGLAASLTPFTYRDFLGPTRAALITAFATGNVFVVLPVLAERSKELLTKLGPSAEESGSAVDVIIPTSFSFPNLGKILTLSFVLFAGWFSDSAVPVSQYLTFALTGLFSFFGDPTVAIPFLLDLLQIPSDTYRFFLVVDNLVGARFGTLLAAMSTLVLAVLGASAVSGSLKINRRKLVRYAALTGVLTFCAIYGTRSFFQYVVPHEYQQYQRFVASDLSRERAPATVHDSSLPPPSIHDPQKSRVREIRERGHLRVGYFKDSLPFAFINDDGKLVGFDVEMAYALAEEMNVALDLVLIERAQAAAMLDAGYVDIVMCGFVVTLERAEDTGFSQPYMDQTIAFVVRDHRREDFGSREKVKALKKVKIAAPNVPYYVRKVREYLPQAEVVLLDSPREFFTRKDEDLDALLYSAEAGSAWSLIYPAYTVAVPHPDVLALPVAYAMARSDREWVDFVNTWIDLKKKDRTIASLYDYWILGKSAAEKEPRWSVIRNVLHWLN
jgi:Na+/H+-dicarboxylate symporter/ABC-type amino acid transport substrate-binding protein